MSATLASLGVGGAGGISDPTQLAGCVLWLKADAGLWQDGGASTPAASNGDPVGRWDDQSGNGNHVVQATNADRPTLATAVLNGLPVVRFDGTSSSLAVAFTLDQPHTRFAVLVNRSPSDGTHILIDGGSGNPSAMVFQTGDVASLNAGTELAGPTVLNSAPHIWRGSFNGASSQISVDGGTASTGDAGSGSAGGITLGTDQTLAQFTDCDVAEVIEYVSALSAGDVIRVLNYLNRRWAVY
jgi:hypothetical protein